MTTTTEVYVATREGSVARTAALTTVAALGTNLSVFAIARAGDVNFQFAQPGTAAGTQTVAAMHVAAVTLLAMTLGWALVGLAARHHRPGLRTMALIGGIVGVVSVLSPLSIDADSSARLTLAGLHLVTGAFYVAGIASLRRAGTGETR